MKHYAHLCKTFKQTLVMKHAPSFGFAWAKKTAAIGSDSRDKVSKGIR
jgi:hypothetical protein